MGQTIEGSDMQLNADLKGGRGKMSIFADKILYEAGAIMFFQNGKEILRIALNKDYSTIYEALKSLGINAEGY